MNEAAPMQSVLRCGQCSKPFDKQSTLKRHGYYCRSRKIGGSPRLRSCVACARGKARCDNKRPRCSRCVIKGSECQYPASESNRTRSSPRRSDNVPKERQKTVSSAVVELPSAEKSRESSNNTATLDPTLVFSDQDFTNTETTYLDLFDPSFHLEDYFNVQLDNDTVAQRRPSSQSPSHDNSPSRTDQTLQMHLGQFSSPTSIPKPPSSSIRSLTQRQRASSGSQRTASLILSTLKSYPLMMLHQNTVPPFIHPILLSPDMENKSLEPLDTCINLVHMISGGFRGCRKLFWKNVRLECERLSQEHTNFSKWEFLAALQALAIYILIRLSEGETDDNNLDFLLVATVIVISHNMRQCASICHPDTSLYAISPKLAWEDWIFEESKRRLQVVYRVVNMLVYFEPSALCELQTDLVIAPLPAKKQLWEAKNESVWKAQSDSGEDFRTVFALAASGELVKLREGQLFCSDGVMRYEPMNVGVEGRGEGNWEEWCSGMDGFGGLVVLAASLVI
ncbi:hypothetical protein BCR34DRAFT_177355 [Clohesyomyces aquaticus]|uniref:Zn(2)-C6 fungal-type domain-containing protein n=1 Tax=Clohesyomyces aquaticus TaxID=1231657 RepID=A0A1Y2A037_9PLEO|nr:hypothetical protein BCR34DRAFT_177355 [Clohesyomyces aquaticus]